MTTTTTFDDPQPGQPLSGAERHREVQRALADALRLARLQAEILVRLEAADRAGDDEVVLCCHAELDDVMARIAETEQVRTGARAILAGHDDLTCAGCGAAAEPVYQQPRLLGYQCAGCGWSGDDPDAQAERKRTEALGAAAAAIAPAIQVIEEATTTLSHRGKQSRHEGVSTLRELQATLAAIDQRLHRTNAA